MLRHAYEYINRVDGQKRKRHAVLTTLIELYDAWGRPEKAAEWRALLAEMEEETDSE